MPGNRNPTVHHLFHASLSHHNRYFVPLFRQQEFNDVDNQLILLNPHNKQGIDTDYHLTLSTLLQFLAFLLKKVKSKDIVVIHGLYSNWCYLIPIVTPWLAKNVVWEIWGDDYYSVKRLLSSPSLADKLRYNIRRYSVPKYGAIAGFKGDVHAVKEHYAFKNKSFDVNHPLRPAIDNLVLTDPEKQIKSPLSVLIGNSGSRSNEHIRAIDLLRKNPHFDDFALFCIFSTDTEQQYTSEFTRYIEENDITNLTIIEDLMSFEEFINFIRSLDCLVLPHKRQQGVGTANLGLVLGKPIYMDSQIATAKYYSNVGVTTLDIESLPQINADELNKVDIVDNANKIRALFGRNAVKQQWYKIIKECKYSG